MTERLDDIEHRIASVHQMEAVVTAMRGIAAARSREARSHLDGIRAYARTVGDAIGEALALAEDAETPVGILRGDDGGIIIVLCSEQGFVGTYNDRILAVAQQRSDVLGSSASQVMLVGDRGLMVAEERGMAISWSAPMAAHADEIANLANRLADAVLDRLVSGASRVRIIHGVPSQSGRLEVADRTLVPIDLGRFSVAGQPVPPLITQQPGELIPQLADEYMYAELCEALTLSFAAENDARMHTMIAARENANERLDELNALFRQLRQTEITEEIIELAAGASAELGGAR